MKIQVTKSVKLSEEEVTAIIFQAVFGVKYNENTCTSSYGYSSWVNAEFSVCTEQEIDKNIIKLEIDSNKNEEEVWRLENIDK